MAKKKRDRPYESAGKCPECRKAGLQQRETPKGCEVYCPDCGWSVDLRPFPMPEAQGYYVGSDGEAYSIHKGFRRLGRKSNRGFIRVRLSIEGRHYYPYLAAAVLTAFDRARPAGYEVAHEDGDVGNCRPDNLTWRLKRAPQTSAKQFVRVWQSSPSIDAVADALGVTPQSAYSRAQRMREHGVPLQQLSLGQGRRLDYDELAEIAREMDGEQ